MGRWVKAHIMCGVKTNIVTAVEVSETKHNDTKILAPFVEKTAQNFNIEEVSADKAYLKQEELPCGRRCRGRSVYPAQDKLPPRAGLWTEGVDVV